MGGADGPAIHAEGLVVERGGRPVVKGLSFDVARGEIVGLLGPNGCGKSSLMRAIVGVQRGVSGTCEVLGHDAGTKPLRTRVGYMTQESSVFRDLTVAENLRYFSTVLGASATRAEEVIEDVDLVSHRDRLVDSLSGGQRNRVSLAVALLGRPEVLVLDEPTVGLDPALRRDLWAQFRDLAGRGTTLLVSSHVMDEARECDSILMMREGELLARGSEHSLLQETGTNDITDAFLALVEAHPAEAHDG
jgi:ABC-2 type transport system ATP-binding protein